MEAVNDDKFAGVKVGDRVIVNRDYRYGGPFGLLVFDVSGRRFKAKAEDGGHYTFRKTDGRVVGNRHHMFFADRIAITGLRDRVARFNDDGVATAKKLGLVGYAKEPT